MSLPELGVKNILNCVRQGSLIVNNSQKYFKSYGTITLIKFCKKEPIKMKSIVLKTSTICLAALLGFSTASHAFGTDKPRIKPGLWEVTMNMQGRKMTMRQCIDDKMQAQSEAKSDAVLKKDCTNIKENKSGNVYTFEATCKMPNGKVRQDKGEITMISSDETKAKITSVSEGKTTVMENHTKRVGDCKAGSGQQSITDDQGKVHNMDDIIKKAQAEAAKHKNH